MYRLQEAQGRFSGCFFGVPLLGARPLPQSWSSHWHPTIAHYNGTLQWHHVHSPKLVVTLSPNHSTLQWHPQSWSPPSPPTIAHYNGTLQWHHVHFPKVGRHHPPPNHSTLQWHPAMAPSNGTTSTPPKLVVAVPPYWK